jgi:UDP-N-acetyl-D-galactosamine dehydrogenase
VADETIKLMLKKNFPVLGSKILILGFTFKENCPDLRNTKVVDIISALKSYNVNVDIYDPWIDPKEAEDEYGIKCLDKEPRKDKYAAIVLAVSHRQFIELGEKGIREFGTKEAVLFDVKSVLPIGSADARL